MRWLLGGLKWPLSWETTAIYLGTFMMGGLVSRGFLPRWVLLILPVGGLIAFGLLVGARIRDRMR